MGSDPCDTFPPASLVVSADELNARPAWFADPGRSLRDNTGPFIVVKDQFYRDPLRIREILLNMSYVQYSPPSPEHVGDELAAEYRGRPAAWFSTAFTVFLGQPVKKAFQGARYNGYEVSKLVGDAIGEQIDEATWTGGGDDWNGAGHLMNLNWKGGSGSIHHHFKRGDVDPRGWSGVVYLSPDAPPSSGTSIWREKSSGLCTAPYGAKFDSNVSNFDLALLVENRFNRLVLFREHVLHRAEHGFGVDRKARLTQTFFFRTV